MAFEPEKYLFLDTNILLHFKLFTLIDWPQIVDTKRLGLVICSPVVDEIDDKKYDSRPHIRDRARQLTSLFHNLIGDKTLNLPPDVTVLLPELMESSKDEEKDLVPNKPDDNILVQIRCFQAFHREAFVILITNDFNLARRARNRGIDTVGLPDSYFEPPKDDLLKENARLKQELNRKSGIPKPAIIFSHPASGSHSRLYRLRLVDPLSPHTLKKHASDVRKRLYDMPEVRALSHNNNDAYEQYAEDVDKWCEGFKRFCEQEDARKQYYSRTVGVLVELTNEGTCPAHNAQVLLSFPDELQLSHDLCYIPKESLDQPPDVSDYEDMASLRLSKITAGMEPLSAQIERVMIRNFKPQRSGPLDKGQVHYTIDEVMHHMVTPLERIFVTFPSNVQPRSFEVGYHIHCENLELPVKGILNVKVETLSYERFTA